MEPVTTALAGIALVRKSVDFIKSNIQTCQDIGQIMGHIDNAMNAEQQVIKDRDKKGADPFATENVAQEIIDAKIAREQLNEIRTLVNYRFGPNTWGEILAERKRRIDAKKEAIREAKRKKAKQIKDIQDLFTYACYGLAVIGMLGAIGYVVYVVLTS